MPFLRPSFAEIRVRAEADVASRLGLAALVRRGFLKVFAAVQAGGSHLLHGHLDWISRQILPDTAEAEYLERRGSIHGVLRKPAAFAEGTVIFDGTDGSAIPAGTLLQRADGVRYAVDADAEITSGIATVTVTAVLAGAAANEDADVELTLVSPIAGVQTVATIAAGGVVNGADAESDEDLRVRVLKYLRERPQGGAVADYEQWALEVAGVTRAWIRPAWSGVGSVGVLFVVDNDPLSIFPTVEKTQEVEEYLDVLRPVTADLVVIGPTPKNLNPTIQLTPNTADVRAAVEASLESLLRREAVPGGTMLVSRLREAVSQAAGESDHVLVSPAANVVSAAHELLVLGTPLWE